MSKETIKRALFRAAYSFGAGAIGAFALVPINLEDPKRYLVCLGVGMVAGGLMGLQKLVKGYITYDR